VGFSRVVSRFPDLGYNHVCCCSQFSAVITIIGKRPLHGIRRRGVGFGDGFLCSFPLSFFCSFLGALYIFLGQAWAEGKGELATCRHRADSGRGKRLRCTPV